MLEPRVEQWGALLVGGWVAWLEGGTAFHRGGCRGEGLQQGVL